MTRSNYLGTTTSTYDIKGRLTQKVLPTTGEVVSYTYDNNDKLLSITDASGVRLFVRDVLGRVTKFTNQHGHDTTYVYDDADRVISSVIATHNETITQGKTYDVAVQVVSFDTGHGTIGYAYTPDGLLAAKSLPNGESETYTYDSCRWLSGSQLSGEYALLYSYDGEHCIVGEHDRIM